MSCSNYTPQVGDQVKRSTGDPHTVFNVLAVDGEEMWLRDMRIGRRLVSYLKPKAFRWVKVEKPVPLPEQWMNVYDDGTPGCGFVTRENAALARQRPALGVVHFWTDDCGEDHVEFERYER